MRKTTHIRAKVERAKRYVTVRVGFACSLLWMNHMVVDGECVEDRGPLFVRYYLLKKALLRSCLHELKRTDAEDVWHSHPWPFVSIIFTSGYVEELPTGERIAVRPWSIIYRPAHWRHRLELEKRAWTLIIAWGRSREWGFYTRDGSYTRFEDYEYAGGRCED